MKFKHIGIILMILVSVMALGCVESQTSATSIDNQNIIISYSTKKIDSIQSEKYGRLEADPGKVFLVITLNIENHGYKAFPINQYSFDLIINNIKYEASVGGNSLLNDELDSVDILDGGSVKGSIAFEVPSNIESFSTSI